jgi:hypothetical protein
MTQAHEEGAIMPVKSTKFRRQGRYAYIKGGVDLATPGGSTKFITWPALTSLTSGTNVTPVAGTRYSCSIYVLHNMLMTGIGYLIGTVGGTDKAIAELHDADGKLIATSALAGVTVGTAATFQELPFTAPVQVLQGWYYLSITMNGTTARLRAIATALGISQVALAKSATGTFGTVGDLTVPTTFTADTGPIAYTY